MRLEPRVLDAPSAEGARLLFGRLLGEAQEQLAGLEQRADPEALHDFRVALRRLRSVERSFRALLPGKGRGKQRRALRDVAEQTSAARDAEVQLAWLAAERGRLPREDRPAARWLAARLEARRRAGYERATAKLARRFRRLAGELARRLARRSRGARRGVGRAPLGVTLAGLLRADLAELLAALDAVRAPLDVEGIHAARIAAKRLRYLLEPLRGSERADAAAAVALVKELQDVLGELHDAHVLGQALGVALLEAARERAGRLHAAVQAGAAPAPGRRPPRDDLTAGLLDLDARVAARISTAYGALSRGWPPARRGALARAVTAVVGALAPGRAERVARRRGGSRPRPRRDRVAARRPPADPRRPGARAPPR